MIQKVPKVRDLMRRKPRVVDRKTSIIEAFTIMTENGFHHLPVVERGRLVGILSDRDILEAWTTLPQEVPLVGEVMVAAPYAVDVDAPLDVVLDTMVGNKIHCVVVRDHGENVVGIFTANDAMVALAELFRGSGGGFAPTPEA